VQREAEVVLHEMDQRRDPLRLERLVVQLAEQLAGLARPEERQLLPALDLLVEPLRHWQHLSEGGAALRAEPEAGRRDVTDQPGVERVPRERHAVHAEDHCPRRSQLHEREVTRPAAEVADQDQLLVIEPLLIAVRRCHRLELEPDVREAGLSQRGLEALDGERLVFRGVGGREANRPPHHDRCPGRVHSELRRGRAMEHAQDDGDQVLEPVLAAEQVGRREQPAREMRLDRLDEAPAPPRLHPAPDRRDARRDAWRQPVVARLLGIDVQDRAKRVLVAEPREARWGPGGGHRDRTVGRSEVEPEHLGAPARLRYAAAVRSARKDDGEAERSRCTRLGVVVREQAAHVERSHHGKVQAVQRETVGRARQRTHLSGGEFDGLRGHPYHLVGRLAKHGVESVDERAGSRPCEEPTDGSRVNLPQRL
jgi:hypothetical protein